MPRKKRGPARPGRRRGEIALAIAALAVGIPALLLYNGFVRFNYPSHLLYPVRGVDVSHHQGTIDWVRAKGPDVTFAFIKATEGADFRDPEFARNWAEASRARIARAAYHYFSFCGGGAEQAANFIAAVPPGQAMLPPAVDVEFSDQCSDPPPVEKIRAELAVLVARLQAAYGCRPILYVTTSSYEKIVRGGFEDCPLWVRNFWWRPRLGDGRTWTFWQFADRGRLEGFNGPVDMNVFTGGESDLDRMMLPG